MLINYNINTRKAVWVVFAEPSLLCEETSALVSKQCDYNSCVHHMEQTWIHQKTEHTHICFFLKDIVSDALLCDEVK